MPRRSFPPPPPSLTHSYLQCNHRSWADFFLDLLVLEARALTLSRLLVLFVFPTTLLSGYALRAVIFFKRGRIADKEVGWVGR